MNNIYRLYLSGPVSKGVAESQMLNWADLLKENGIITDFLVVYNNGNQEKFVRMKSLFAANTIFAHKYYNYFPIREVTFFKILYTQLKYKSKKADKTIIQTRSAAFAIPLLFLNVFFRFKTIYEIRGAGEEGSKKKWITYCYTSFNNMLLLKISPKIIMVSRRLLEHNIKSLPFINFASKTEIVYGAADSQAIYFDRELRKIKRKEFNLENKLVILYIGMLDKSWQIPDVIFKFISDLMRRMNNLFFLVITPNIDIGYGLQIKYDIKSSDILIKESQQDMLNGYINASDFGLLLRENVLVNNVSSPTKFSEYLLGGLPVLISEGVGDFSGFTTENDVGIVVNTESPDFDFLVSNMCRKDYYNRHTIQETGRNYFSKQRYIESLSELYKAI